MKLVTRLMWLGAGCVALVLTVVGFLIPVLPGILFLMIALVCFANASNTVHRRLHNNPRLRPYFTRWDASTGMHWWQRTRLGLWLCLAAAGDTLRGTTRRTLR